MPSEPTVIAQIGDWALTRRDYPGAPLVAERKRRKHPTIEVKFDASGDLSVDIEGEGGVYVPAAVIERLIADRDGHQTASPPPEWHSFKSMTDFRIVDPAERGGEETT